MKEIKIGDYLVTQNLYGIPIYYKVTKILNTCYKAKSINGYGEATILKDSLVERTPYDAIHFEYAGSEIPKELLDIGNAFDLLIGCYDKYRSLKNEVLKYLGKIKYLVEDFSEMQEVTSFDGEKEAVEKAIEKIRESIK